MSSGCVCGWTSPALLYLQGHPSGGNGSDDGTLSVQQACLAGSLAPIGALVGSLPAVALADFLGRRTASQVLSLPLLLGWVILAMCGRQLTPLYIARLLHGMCVGVSSVVTPLYNEEIAEVSARGSLGSLYDCAMGLGVLWVNLAGTVMPYAWMNLSAALPAVLSFAMLFLVPESPVHLLARGQDQQARAALSWLRGPHHDVESELASTSKLAHRGQGVSAWTLLRSVKDINCDSLRSPSAKSLLIVSALMTARQLSGMYAITFYAVEVFQEAGSSLDESTSATVTALFDLGVTVAMVFSAELTGRRTLLTLSCWGCAFFLTLLAVGPSGWLPLAAVIGYNTAFSVGLGPVPWFMMGELVPTEAKSWVIGVVVTLNWLLMFFVTQFFMSTVAAIGHMPTYLCYAAVNALAGTCVLLFLPETRGKSLDKIQLELGGN
ncbi:facilitated trehalose transporter Tret1-like isoform X2 [Bacillus rossius redtenbacheri]